MEIRSNRPMEVNEFIGLAKLAMEQDDRARALKKAKEDEAKAEAQAYWKSRYAGEIRRGMRRPEDVPDWLSI